MVSVCDETVVKEGKCKIATNTEQATWRYCRNVPSNLFSIIGTTVRLFIRA